MKNSLKLCVVLFIFTWTHSFLYIHCVSSQCLHDQKSLLTEFLSGVEYIDFLSTKLVTWNQSIDCCQWSGVECNRLGQVIGLDLSAEAITKGIDSHSSLFRLLFLQRLNLAGNLDPGKIPSAVGKLSSLTYLNLSDTSFSGQVPVELSQLMNLVVLDISFGGSSSGVFSAIQIRNPTLAVIIRNMTNLRELYLDGIVISDAGNKWGEALSSSVPHLQVLSMQNCSLTGGFHPTLAKLHSLSVVRLDSNNLSAPVPEFFASFTNLTTLSLSFCELLGTFPNRIFEIPTLEVLDLTVNENLQGTLPHSIGDLKRLTTLDLMECNFQGIIPLSLGSLRKLEHVDLSLNNFSGPVPSFSSAKSLAYLSLGYNSLTGSIPETLVSVDAPLKLLDLSNNNLEGPIPKAIFQLRSLDFLVLSENRFNSALNLYEILLPLQNLETLDLSGISLSTESNGTIANSTYPLLTQLYLISTNLRVLPEFLKKQPYLYILDLSNNQIEGKIPRWIWRQSLTYLNLSCNNFVEVEHPLPLTQSPLKVLDLHSNKLQGELPAILYQKSLQYLDFSNNSFSTFISSDFANSIRSAQFVSLARNKVYGTIPASLCNATSLQVLDLSYNDLNGTIPFCLTTMSKDLAVLSLRANSLHGPIPDEFGEYCALETLNFNMNFLDGHIPRSLANCKKLKVLDLGNNRLKDNFPCHLKTLSSLQVLVLRSNQFHGTVDCSGSNSLWPLLQIIDLASNGFKGHLSGLFLGNWMMTKSDETPSEINFLQYGRGISMFTYYQDDVQLTFKGFEFELQKILTIFTSIDLSDNDFQGEFPRKLEIFNALKVLNLSHNSLSGYIPRSIGNLSELESLDLCCNSFSGSIPQQLATLSFLGFLNLSFNNFAGLIPETTQLQTFDASSYMGNPGLYGPPLTQISKGRQTPRLPTHPDGSNWSSKSELAWILSGAAVGFPTGIIMFFGPLLLIKRWREWYNYHSDRLLMEVMQSQDRRKQKRKRAATKN